MVLKDEITAVAVVGLGLIGGSLARRLQTAAQTPTRTQTQVVVFDTDRDTRAAAGGEGLTVAGSLEELMAGGSDIVFVATPMPAFAPVFQELSRLSAGRDVVVTDVGSVKQPVVDDARRAGLRYVGGHPMAGTEWSGFESSDASLFEGAAWVLCLEEDTDRSDFVLLARLLAGVGADVVPLSAASHDAVLARISQLPHVVAAAIATLAGEHPDRDLLYRLAAGSFHSATRVAATRPDLTTDMCLANREALLAAIEELTALTEQFHRALKDARPDEVRTFFESAHRHHKEAAGREVAEWLPVEINFEWRSAPLAPAERAELLRLGAMGGIVSAIEVDRRNGSCTVTGLVPRLDGGKGGSDADPALRRSTRDL